MEFVDILKQFSEQVKQRKEYLPTEEATKMSLIAPFFQLLGYDIFNPAEFCPEYTADVGIKKGEKVDYAILINDVPVILIEAKAVNKKLEKHDSQLFRYFSTTNARFAILTNGIVYKLYTDLAEKNKMDREPFYEFNMLNLSEDDIREISKFSKQNFNEEDVFNNASLLKYANLFKNDLQKQLVNPDDDFVRFFLKDNYKGIKTQTIVDKFRPILKKSFNDYIDSVIKEKMTSIINESGYITAETTVVDKFAPTDMELDCLTIIKTILKDTVNMDDISYKKTESYFGILYKGNVRKWIARLIFSNAQITLITPDSNKAEIRYKINNINEIELHKATIETAVKMYTAPIKEYVYTKWGKYEKPAPYKINLSRNFPK